MALGKKGDGQAPKWDTVITASPPWWRLDLKEIWAYRDLLVLLVRRDLLAVYKQTVLGPMWQVIQPLLTSLMFAVIFGLMGRMSVAHIPPMLFYMSGVVPWTFFANVLTRTSQTLVSNSNLMTKVYFPRLISPLATTASTAVSGGIQLASFFLLALGYRLFGSYAWSVDASILLLPVLVLLLVSLAFGLGTLVSALTTQYRDFTFLVGFGIQLLMYMSAVIFPLSLVHPDSKIRIVLEINPMTPVIENFRAILVGTPADLGSLWYTAVFALLSMFVGLVAFRRVEQKFADVI